jgi:hypothetical protein
MIEHEPDPLRRIPTKHTPDVRAEIGPTLRAARTKRGQTIDAVAQQTRISKRFLDALENDRFDEFPAFVYMRGFLKSYCEYLELNFEELWAKVEAKPAPASTTSSDEAAGAAPVPGSPSAPPSNPAAVPSAPKPKAVLRPATAHEHAHGRAPAEEPARSGSSAALAMTLAGGLALGLGVLIFGDRKAKNAPPPADATPRALRPLARAIEPKVSLTAKEDAWVRASVDGNVVFEGRLPRGASMEWRPARQFALRSTSPAALQLTVNGAARALENPSPDGDYKLDL